MENCLYYLIPWDFTPVAENALRYAIITASKTEQPVQIVLVHVLITSGVLSKNRLPDDQAQQKLTDDVARIKKEYKVDVDGHILKGKLFDVINEYANELNASLIFIGTHGIKGMQKFTGSWTLKIIAGSDIPFIVVQDEAPGEKIFQNIVMPLSFQSHDREKVIHSIKFAHQFSSKINIITPFATDSGVQRKINMNLGFAKQQFEDTGVSYELHEAVKGRSFHEEVVRLATDIKSDLIIIMTTSNLDFIDYVFGAQEQYVIANNAKIPVMCITPGAVKI